MLQASLERFMEHLTIWCPVFEQIGFASHKNETTLSQDLCATFTAGLDTALFLCREYPVASILERVNAVKEAMSQ